MSFELDHVFVAASVDAPEIQLLRDDGFVEGPAHDHPGQGTASRGIFFENAYLELIWLVDAQVAAAASVRRTGLAQRADPGQGASPFGFGLRSPLDPLPDAPFESWTYSPDYLPEDCGFAMSTNSERLDEPLIFVLPWSRTVSWATPTHPNGVQRITKVSFVLGARSPSRELAAFPELGLVSLEDGVEPVLRIELDHGHQGEKHDLRPRLPLALHW